MKVTFFSFNLSLPRHFYVMTTSSSENCTRCKFCGEKKRAPKKYDTLRSMHEYLSRFIFHVLPIGILVFFVSLPPLLSIASSLSALNVRCSLFAVRCSSIFRSKTFSLTWTWRMYGMILWLCTFWACHSRKRYTNITVINTKRKCLCIAWWVKCCQMNKNPAIASWHCQVRLGVVVEAVQK